jgi:hypothetical protein
MTRDELFKLASESGMLLKRRFVEGNEKFTGDCLERFAALVAAHERQACAQLVEHIYKAGGGTYGDAIRARGQE